MDRDSNTPYICTLYIAEMEYPADESIVSVCLVPNSSRQQHSVDPVSPRSATILYQTSYVGERGVRNKALLLHLISPIQVP